MNIIDGFAIDVVDNVTISRPSQSTEFPVERGVDVADHVRTLPVKISLQGTVSDTPIGFFVLERAEISKPSEAAREHFKAIQEARSLITVVLAQGTFTNMVLVNVTEIDNSRIGDAYSFRAEFKEIKLIDNNRVFVEVANPRARKKRKRGSKSPKETPKQAPEPAAKTKRNQSILHGLIN